MTVWRPDCCYRCESRSVKQHCVSPSCPWVECGKCGALSARVAVKPGTSPYTSRRAYYGGRDRDPGPPPPT